MTENGFDIYFSGKLLPDHDLKQVKQAIGQLFKADKKLLDHLFSGNPVRIKKNVDMDKAIKYRVKFRQIGALVDIRPSQAETKPEQEQKQPAKTSNKLDLAQPGVILDHTPAPPEPRFNLDVYEAAAPGDGSLEEFAKPVLPVPLPDISTLEITDTPAPLDEHPLPEPPEIDTASLDVDPPGEILDSTPAPEPVAINTDGLQAMPANTGSLEDCNTRPPPQPLPDISKLKLE